MFQNLFKSGNFQLQISAQRTHTNLGLGKMAFTATMNNANEIRVGGPMLHDKNTIKAVAQH